MERGTSFLLPFFCFLRIYPYKLYLHNLTGEDHGTDKIESYKEADHVFE